MSDVSIALMFGLFFGFIVCLFILLWADTWSDKKRVRRITTEIRVPAKWATGEGEAIFRRGVGPCGKTVTNLGGYWSGDNFIVFQYCGTERKEFTYLRSQITGRIVLTSNNEDLTDPQELCYG